MASRLTPIGWIAKFIVVPIAVGAAGFYWVGPRIGAVKPPPVRFTEAPADAPSSPGSEAANPSDTPPEGVEVSVKPKPGGTPSLGHDSDQDTSSNTTPDDSVKPRVRRRHLPPSMVAPPTDPGAGGDGSGGQ